MKCETCKNSIKAQNENYVGCKLMNSIGEDEISKFLKKIEYAKKEIYQGYTNTDLITWTWMVPKNATCYYYEKVEVK